MSELLWFYRGGERERAGGRKGESKRGREGERAWEGSARGKVVRDLQRKMYM